MDDAAKNDSKPAESTVRGSVDATADRSTKKRKRTDAPDAEPRFTLRARDVCAATALATWINRARANAAPPEKIESAQRVLADFEAWAAEHRDEMKVPD